MKIHKQDKKPVNKDIIRSEGEGFGVASPTKTTPEATKLKKEIEKKTNSENGSGSK